MQIIFIDLINMQIILIDLINVQITLIDLITLICKLITAKERGAYFNILEHVRLTADGLAPILMRLLT